MIWKPCARCGEPVYSGWEQRGTEPCFRASCEQLPDPEQLPLERRD